MPHMVVVDMHELHADGATISLLHQVNDLFKRTKILAVDRSRGKALCEI